MPTLPRWREWLGWQRLRYRPCVRQHAIYDCGAATLATVARHYGYHLSLEAARELVHTDPNGTTIWYLRDGAVELGFEARPARATYDALTQIDLPAICHYEEGDGHWVVVYAAGERYVVVADPAQGMRRLPRAEFARRWSGYVLTVSPGPTFQRRADESPPVRVFLRMVLAERAMLGATLLAALVAGALGWATAAFLQVVFDRVLPEREMGLLLPLAAGLILASILQAMLQIGRNAWEASVGRRVQVAYVKNYVNHLFQLPAQTIEIRCKGGLYQRIAEAGHLRRAVGQGVVALAADLATLTLALGLLAIRSPVIALIALLSIPLMLLLIFSFHLPTRSRRDILSHRNGEFSNHFFESLEVVRPIKVFQAERHMVAAMQRQIDVVADMGTELQRLTMLPAALTTLVSSLTTIVVLGYGAAQVVAGTLTSGQFIFMFSLLAFVLVPVQRLPAMSVLIQEALVVIDRIEAILALPSEQSLSGNVQLERLEGRIELREVNFGYAPRRPVLRGVSMVVEPGQTVAIVGETGSGKSSIAALLAGLYTPTTGEVLFDGYRVAELDRSALRRHISAVFQKPYLIEGSLAENITLGMTVAPEAIREAAVLAQADPFIATKPRGYDSKLLGGGTNLSGGQAQRLGMARALLRDAPVLILDEATSHLDSDTEQTVWANLKQTRRGKTTVIIAHRLSTIIDADRIYVLEGGRITEAGTHDELMALRGSYHRIFRWQATTPERVTG